LEKDVPRKGKGKADSASLKTNVAVARGGIAFGSKTQLVQRKKKKKKRRIRLIFVLERKRKKKGGKITHTKWNTTKGG